MSLSDLVLSIADNKQMLGLRYAEWATRAPSLEADIAAAAMGLDDLGHSRVLYGCLEPLGEDPRSPERETDPGSLRLRKMLMEERYHFLHGRSWLRSGIDTEPLHRAWREAIEWFGPPDGETTQLYKEGRLSMGPAELRERLEELLESRAPEMTIEWKLWDPIRRRGRKGAIDESTFAMLRGLEEKKFAPAAQAKEA
ncbi:MAG: hypothetical protein E6I23_06145 [Chloroflexi bacterium]|nr:MAG: hypothetical protein E6I23_06145 [Chloroflexota bacterium]